MTKGNENVRPSDADYNTNRTHDDSNTSLNFMNITHMGHPQSIPKTQSLDIIKLKNRFKNYQHNDNIIYEVKEEQERDTPQRRLKRAENSTANADMSHNYIEEEFSQKKTPFKQAPKRAT